ncbi:MAG: N-acetyl-gamma-glutamyl-phosphate reductase [Deltaproteobacteria bacterium]|nr:N-acetyl-gamma-glutamyl-phosphate reductase [Deltaproteobacteria bacterium]
MTQENTIRAGLVGVTGYTGMELARLLAGHPHIRLTAATSRTEAGRRLGEMYPFLEGLPGSDVTLIEPDPDKIAENCDVAFLAVPHQTAAQTAAALLERNIKVVDLSADFRLHDAATYAQWYAEHPCPQLLPEAIYGLPERYMRRIKNARLVANPGCYPTSVILGLAAALKCDLIEREGIVIDSKSGTTGAGRKASVSSLYCEVADTFRAYGIGGKHRHTPEIEQELGILAKQEMTVSFNPHLVPMNRGILSTIYAQLKGPLSTQDARDIFAGYWSACPTPWVRILPAGKLPETRNVRGSMFCDIAVVTDPRTNRLIVVSAIDNICRGASGQAVANANLMFGLPVTEGLSAAPMLP